MMKDVRMRKGCTCSIASSSAREIQQLITAAPGLPNSSFTQSAAHHHKERSRYREDVRR